MLTGKLLPMSCLEFSYWQHFHRIEPFGDEQADLRAARIAMAIHRFAGKIAEHEPNLEDYLRDLGRFEDETPTPSAVPARVNAVMGQLLAKFTNR
jgi:hypothetical protein